LKKAASLAAPPPSLLISQWADQFRQLSSEASAEPGRWVTERAPYQRAIKDALADPTVEAVVVMSSAQIGKTEIINNVVGYHIHLDPAPILLLQPTLEMAEAWSKDRFAPMLRDTRALRGLVRDPRSRDSGNTLLHKRFPGGHITMAGANSPASLASRPIRLVLCDEVDRYPVSATPSALRANARPHFGTASCCSLPRRRSRAQAESSRRSNRAISGATMWVARIAVSTKC
jgi:phage terminase large subunit GpA-like protein